MALSVPPAVIASIFKSLGIDIEKVTAMAQGYLEELQRHNRLLEEIAENQRRMMHHAGLSNLEGTRGAGNTDAAAVAGTACPGAGIVDRQPNGAAHRG